MKIICNKCNNEFIFKGDTSSKNVYMVKCPVCKTPITVRMDSYHVSQKEKERDSMSFKDKNISNDNFRAHPDDINNMVRGSKDIKGDIRIQQDMINQIEKGADSIMDTSDEIYYDMNLSSINTKGETGAINNIRALMNDIDPYSVRDKYIPYVYYAVAIFIVFTVLFLFSDFIRLDNISGSINPWVHAIVYVFKHYV